jgi:hypothetical protein
LNIEFVRRQSFSKVLALLKDMLLVCSFCFLDATFLEVATNNNAIFQFFEFASGSLPGFEDKFTRMMSLILCGVSPRIKVQWSMSILIAI